MKFSSALSALLHGNAEQIANSNWNGKGMYVGVQRPDSGSVNTAPYIYMVYSGKRVPWTPSQQDLFSEDWVVLS